MLKEKIAIEQAKEAFVNVAKGKEFTCAEIKEIVGNKNFIPSDYCYNRSNDGINIERNIVECLCLFIYVERNCYKYVGTDYLYEGDFWHNPKGGKEYIAGKIKNRRVIWNN